MHKTEGIVLHTLRFQDYDQIVTLFTQDYGLLKGIYKGGLSHRRKKGMMASPLLQVEILITKGKGELYKIQELFILDHALPLRASLANLETGCNLAKILFQTQLPGKYSPELYHLFAFYLKALPQWDCKEVLEASFRLKRLRHDGLFALGDACAVCQQPLLSISYQKKESYCKKHAPIGALSFASFEKEWIRCLIFCRKLSELKQLQDTPDKFKLFFEKIKDWETLIGID